MKVGAIVIARPIDEAETLPDLLDDKTLGIENLQGVLFQHPDSPFGSHLGVAYGRLMANSGGESEEEERKDHRSRNEDDIRLNKPSQQVSDRQEAPSSLQDYN